MNEGTLPLAELQRQFQAYLLKDATTRPAAVVGDIGAGVYLDAYMIRIVQALETDYPALRTFLGPVDFAEVAQRYVLARPSSHYSIRWAGRNLGEFLRSSAPYAAEPYLAELAAFEWLLGEAFDAADDATIDTHHLARIPAEAWAGLMLRFHPSLRRLDLHFDVVEIWKTLTESSRCPALEVMRRPESWILWRSGLEVLYRPLKVEECAALDVLRQGGTFADAATRVVTVCEMDPAQAPRAMAGWLRTWLQQGLITATVLMSR